MGRQTNPLIMKSPRIPSTVYEIQWPNLSFDIDEKVELFLLSQKIPLENICTTMIDGKNWSSFYVTREKKALDLVARLKRELKLKAKMRVLFKDDWQDVWKKDFKPFALTPCIMVVPRWEKKNFIRPANKKVIYIDTAMAFGTGLHETTQFMSQLIEARAMPVGSFLDIGTGTGILAMVAKLSGAQKVHAVDIAPDAVKTAHENLKVNGITIDFLRVFDIGDYPATTKFDFVAANLVTDDLLKFQQKIWRCVKSGGLCAVSGISLENLPRFKKNWIVPQAKILEVKRGKQWSAVLFKKES